MGVKRQAVKLLAASGTLHLSMLLVLNKEEPQDGFQGSRQFP